MLVKLRKKAFFAGNDLNDLNIKSGKKGLARNIASLGIVQIANYVLPLLSIPIISRIIGPDKFGVINFSASFVAYFTLLIGFGFDLSATRKIAADPFNQENRNKVFSEVFFCQLLLLSISVICFTICVLRVPQLKVESKVALFSFLICISTLLTQNWLFQAMQDLSKVALLNFVSKLLFTVLILLVIRAKSDYVWYPLVLNLVNIAIAVISFTWGCKRYNIKLKRIPFRTCLQLFWNEKMIFFSLVVINLYTTTNIVILGLFHNDTQVAYYTSAQRLIAVIQALLTVPLYQAFYPYVGKAFGESREKGMQIVQKILPVILLFTGTASLFIFCFGPWFLTLFYGKAFSPAAPVIRILAFVPMIIAVSNLFGIQIMLNMKMDRHFFYITASGAVISICLNILLLQKWGYIGSAVNSLVIELFINICMFVVLRKNGMHPLNRQYFTRSAIMDLISPFISKLTRK